MPHIDHIALENFFRDDTDMLIDLAIFFAQALGDCKARLNYSVDNHDALTLCETVHLLKSRLGYFSATGLKDLASNIELKGKEQHFNDIRPILADLLIGIEEMMSELREITGMQLLYEADE